MSQRDRAYRFRLFIAFAATTKLLNLAMNDIISSSSPASFGNGSDLLVTLGLIQGSIFLISIHASLPVGSHVQQLTKANRAMSDGKQIPVGLPEGVRVAIHPYSCSTSAPITDVEMRPMTKKQVLTD